VTAHSESVSNQQHWTESVPALVCGDSDRRIRVKYIVTVKNTTLDSISHGPIGEGPPMVLIQSSTKRYLVVLDYHNYRKTLNRREIHTFMKYSGLRGAIADPR
jgi:hypothetical protein